MGFDHKNQVPLGLLTPSQSLSPSWVGIPLTQCDGPRWLWYVVAAAVLALGLRPSATGDDGSISLKDRDVDRGDAGSISFRGKSSMGQAEGFDKA